MTLFNELRRTEAYFFKSQERKYLRALRLLPGSNDFILGLFESFTRTTKRQEIRTKDSELKTSYYKSLMGRVIEQRV